jgi:hypothetical protein
VDEVVAVNPRHGALVVIAITAALAGCSNDPEDQAAEPAATATVTVTADASEASEPAASTLTAEPTKESEPAQPAEPNVGEKALRVGDTREGTGFRTTLLEIKYPYPPGQYREPQPGKQFLGLRLKQCMRTEAEPSGEDYSTSGSDWYAATPNGEQYSGDGSSWNDWPSPKFPESVTLNPGDCLTGWIANEVPIGTKIVKIIWRPGGETTAEWLP